MHSPRPQFRKPLDLSPILPTLIFQTPGFQVNATWSSRVALGLMEAPEGFSRTATLSRVPRLGRIGHGFGHGIL